MLYIRPSFYKKFKCIADRCTDSCCVGWEINIDDASMDIYKNMQTVLGSKIRNNIIKNAEGEYSFRLLEGERCPFLNDNNLCDIITDCGEDCICYICKEHPRFYNDFPGATEYGLGLCCEEAVRLLLEDDEPLSFEVIEADEEYICEADEEAEACYEEICNIRNEIYKILESDISYDEKLQGIISFYADFSGKEITPLTDEEILSAYEKTEPINEEWTEYFKNLKCRLNEIRQNEKPFDELSNGNDKYSEILSYIIFRHLVSAVYDENESIGDYLIFCISSVRFIKLCDIKTYLEKGLVSQADRINNIKRWSKQIEYSDENIMLLIF